MVCFLLASQVVGQAASQVPQNSYNVRRTDGLGCTSVCLTKNGHVVFGATGTISHAVTRRQIHILHSTDTRPRSRHILGECTIY